MVWNLSRKTQPSLLPSLYDELNEFFNLPAETARSRGMFMPSVDVWEDEQNVYVETDMPGMEAKDIDASVQDGSLVISANKEQQEEDKKKNYWRTERYKGRFYREIGLPTPVDNTGIKAKYKNGVLQITAPKKQEERAEAQKIKIE
ncbi:MAG: Hsp20/alpha crystallin family protein [Candidatus Omnitrophota bacterium]